MGYAKKYDLQNSTIEPRLNSRGVCNACSKKVRPLETGPHLVKSVAVNLMRLS
jgi:hypothetical protein